jgi:methylmalonyl-CoA mutase N-terminal domain/subunit
VVNSHDASKENSDFGKRIARNIHHILLHEASFSEALNASEGCYYIDYLTYQFARRTWEEFTR